MSQNQERGNRKKFIGLVVSDKMDKTVVVEVTKRVKHKLYRKYVNRCVKYHAHDETNSCSVGDKVQIIETRPLSKMKRWRVQNILAKAL